MKLLVAYDGSSCSEAALDDLVHAGFPKKGEALIISVGEGGFLMPESHETINLNFKLKTKQFGQTFDKSKKAVFEAETIADHAKKRLLKILPKWKITSQTEYGSPGGVILKIADDYKPDLIVVGSHGRSAISRLLLGSISNKVLNEARCSVRIARGKIEVDPTPTRLIIGFDGTQGSQITVDAVATRRWREFSEVRLVVVTDSVTPTTIGRFLPPVTDVVEEINLSEREWIEKIAENALFILRKAGLDPTLQIRSGNPKQILVEEAKRWNADCIFLGANAQGSSLSRFLTGSTSAAIASRANCSVEIVRESFLSELFSL